MEKLKPEFVNDITFLTEKDRRGNVTSIYTDDFRAIVSVKIGNAVKELMLAQNSEYVPSTGYGTPDYKESFTRKWSGLYHRIENPFQDLITAGIEIDFSEIIFRYGVEVVKAKLYLEDIKKENEEKRIVLAKENYKTSWPVLFKAKLEAERNKTIKAAKDLIVVIPSTEKDYVYSGNTFVDVFYKSFKIRIYHEGGKFCSRSACEIKPDDKEDYIFFKEKKSIQQMTILLKFIEEVDNLLVTREYVKKKTDTEYQKRREIVKILEEASGYPVTTFKKEEYSRNRNASPRNWIEYSYKLVTSIPDSQYGIYEGINVGTYVATVFDSEKQEYVEDPTGRKYSIEGIRNLSKEQFKKILDVLLESKIVLNVNIKEDKIEN